MIRIKPYLVIPLLVMCVWSQPPTTNTAAKRNAVLGKSVGVDYRTLQPVRTLRLPPSRTDNSPSAGAVVFSPDSKQVTAVDIQSWGGDRPYDQITWDVESGRLIRTVKRRPDNDSLGVPGVSSIAYSWDGSLVATVEGGDLVIRRVDSDQILHKFTSEGGSRYVAFSKDGSLIAGGGYACSNCEDPPGIVLIWDLKTGKLRKELDFNGTQNVSHIAFSPDGRALVSGSGDIWLWNANNWSLKRKLSTGYEIRTPFIFSPNGMMLVSGGGIEEKQGIVTVWDANTGRTLRKILHGKMVYSLAISPDGGTLATSAARSLKLWNVNTGALIKTLIVTKSDIIPSVSSVFSPDGCCLATSGGDGVTIWRLASLKETR